MNIIKAVRLAYGYSLRDEDNKIIETQQALKDLDFEIEESSFVCVLGHNGSGKSTLARLMNALSIPTSGTLYVTGLDTADPDNTLDIRKSAGMVFQNPDNQLVANVVEEDVAFGPENLGLETNDIVRRVNEALNAVGMTAYRMKSPNQLSGGQKQRVAIAGSIAMTPKCIILDEPTAMLDPNGRKEVLEAVHSLNKSEGITVILITHYMEEAVDADRCIVMENGEIARDADGNPLDGTPGELFSRVDELKRHSLSVPVITELAYELKKSGLDIPGGILRRKELVDALRALGA